MRYCDWCGEHMAEPHDPSVIYCQTPKREYRIADNRPVVVLDLCYPCEEKIMLAIKEYVDECRRPPNTKAVKGELLDEHRSTDSKGQTKENEADTYSLDDEVIRQNKILGHSSHSPEKRD